MRARNLLLSTLMAGMMASGASAATIWASSIVEASKADAPLSERDAYAHSYGEADGSFYSLGLGGYAVFSFGGAFISPGTTVEITYGVRSAYNESAEIYGSVDGVTYDYLASVSNESAASDFTFAGQYVYLKLVDTSEGGAGRDGFDVDAIGVSPAPTSHVSPVPLPAAGLMLLSGIVGIGARRFFGKKA